MSATSTYRYRIVTGTGTEVNHGQIIAHFTRIVAAMIIIAAQPKFASEIISPTFGGVVVEDSTAVVKTNANFFDGTGVALPVGAKIDL